MANNTKHYILTAITLGAIGAVSAGLISVSNLLTRNKIAQNEKDKIQEGISQIFGDNSSIKEEDDLSGYSYTNHVYTIEDNNKSQIGYAFRTTGSNMYGKISLIIGFLESSHKFNGLSIVVNEQTYASTFVENYINPLNENKTEDALNDVSCGATYGAKLVKSMVEDATNAANKLWEKNNG